MFDFKNKKILLAVTGSIAAYKVCQLVRDLAKQGADVHVAMTKSACKFIGPITFEVLSGNRVLVDLFDDDLNHLDLARGADLLVVAPATANIIGKSANGIADDAVSTLFLSVKCPVLFVPAMHEEMWQNSIVQANVTKLRSFNFDFLGPEVGDLACGDVGEGRFVSNKKVLDRIESLLRKKDLEGRKILITVGPTYEAIDPVRYISNWSSGKMGRDLVREFYMRGAEVHVVSSLDKDFFVDGITFDSAKTADEMKNLVHQNIESCDTYVSVAAIADFRPQKIAKNKLNKQDLAKIDLELNDDILLSLAEKKGKKNFIAFVLDSELSSEKALQKQKEKNLDLCIAVTNAAFSSDRIHGQILSKANDKIDFDLSKSELANKICDLSVNP